MQFDLAVPVPDRIEDLTEPEHLLLRSLRRWIAGLHGCRLAPWQMAWNELAVTLGPARARDALGGLTRLVCVLGGHARRPLRHHPPCCGHLTLDEFRLAALVTALGRGDRGRARALAEWLVVMEGVPDLLAAGARLASAFRGDGADAVCGPN